MFIEECGYVKDETTKPLRMKDLYDEYWEYTREKLKMTPVYRPEFKRRLRDNLNFKIKEKVLIIILVFIVQKSRKRLKTKRRMVYVLLRKMERNYIIEM